MVFTKDFDLAELHCLGEVWSLFLYYLSGTQMQMLQGENSQRRLDSVLNNS